MLDDNNPEDRVLDTEVLKRTGMQSVHTLLKQLRWTGHVTRMHEERLPKKDVNLYEELEMGKHSHGGQKK